MLTLFLILLSVVLAAVVIGILLFGGDALILWFAKHDEWWSPLRSKAPAGQFFVMAKGKSDGDFDAIYHSVRGVVLLDNHDFVENEAAWQLEQDEMGYIERELGVVWVGFFKKYYLAPVKYVSIDKISGRTEFALVEKNRVLTAIEPYFYWQYLMAATALAAEIKGNLKIDMVFLFTGRIQNAYKALFLAGKFTVRLTTVVERCSREFVRNMEFDAVRLLQGSGGGTLPGELDSLGDTARLRDEFGLEVDNSEFVGFGETAGDPEITKALTSRKVNELNASGILAIADAEATRLEKRYGAISSLAGAEAFALSEAIRDAKPSTVVIGNAPFAVSSK